MAFVNSTVGLPRLRAALALRSCSSRASKFIAARNPALARLPTRRFVATSVMVAEGQSAPDFERNDIDGNRIKLSELRGSNVILYFSALQGPGCTSQSCTFRDAAEDFASLDAKIIAISAQGGGKSSQFKRTNRLSFPIVSDPDKELQKLYGVPATFGLIPGRVTFVIDKEGVVQKIFNSQFNVTQHVAIAKETLQALAK
ncbi:Peroxiredoxin [Gracilaria domingensis]|nr:Peroxiredoxin [Gracilaria domingensis]